MLYSIVISAFHMGPAKAASARNTEYVRSNSRMTLHLQVSYWRMLDMMFGSQTVEGTGTAGRTLVTQ